MHPYVFLVAAASVTSALCAGWFLARNPGQRANQLACLLMLAAAFWAACETVWNQAPDPEAALWCIRLSTPGWAFIGPLCLHIFLSASPRPWPRMRRLVPVLYTASCAFVAMAWSTNLLTSTTERTSWGYAYGVGPAFPLFYAVTMVGVIGGVIVVSDTFRKSYSPAERRQLPWLLVGVGVPLVGASVTDALLPALGVPMPRIGSTTLSVLGGVAVWNVFHFGHSFLTPGSFANEILATLPDGVALVERGGAIRSCNRALTRLSGRSSQELEGLPLEDILCLDVEAALSAETERECELAHSGGERIPVSISTCALEDQQRYALGFLVVVRDLREVVELRSRLVTSARLVAVGELAAGVAHEINNPIAYVRANLSQLQAHWKTLGVELSEGARERGLGEVVDEGNELLEECVEGVDRAADIVRGVKGFAHVGGSRREFADVNQLLDEVLRVAQGELRGRARIERTYSELPAIPCSPQELKQVFLNLIVNAAQALGDGGVIELRTWVDDQGVWVDVDDDGAGIPREIIDRIFDPFFTTKGVGEGTGLGLGISYQIVRQHGGEISVDSQPGRGSRFRVRLALDRDEETDPAGRG